MCINPYHYRRIESAPILPPVLVPRFPINNGQTWKPIPDPPLPYNQTINSTPRSNYHFGQAMSPAVTMGDNMSVIGHGQQIGLPLSPHGGPGTPVQNVLSPKAGSVTSPNSCMSSPSAQAPSDYNSYGSPGQFGVQSPAGTFQSPQTFQNNQNMAGTSCVYSSANATSYPNSPSYVQGQTSTIQSENPYPQVDQKPQNGDYSKYSEVRMEQPSVWASFTYYELNTRVGDPYQ